MNENDAKKRTGELLKRLKIDSYDLSYITAAFLAERSKRKRWDGNVKGFDDTVSYPVDNGDGTTTFDYRCAQDPLTVANNTIVSLDVVGVCGTSSLYHLTTSS